MFVDASDDVEAYGRELLAQVAPLSPPEQVGRVPGPVALAVSDIETAKVGLFGGLSFVTERHGDRYSFGLPRAAKKQVKAWAKQATLRG